jgi:predicted nuclease of predicted toxin-antitoxin system
MSAAGYDTLHTRDLPEANATRDSQINALSLAEQRVVITKDADFVQSFTLQGRPYKLLLVSTGNIRNAELFELARDALIIHA